ncbi:carbohydrate kinase [Corynebacterium felinum]|uniref:Fructokinase n=1 Tax=Corynebacterium felinum TaxID=131318 RepID=A0ABU2BEV0_9CORY|nr:carbohydrate kinase [Corynebacterium felinum]MDF5819932.1 carbohydrate kinase [Corynebacterium felinum]MDR7355924.1 fructokinase [Corynebacterium felinum]
MRGNYTGGMITVCGEGLVDLVPMVDVADGVDARVAPLQPALGGGPFNVAIASARQGVPVQFVSRLSSDGFGSALVDKLKQEGVDVSLVQRGDEPTTLALASRETDGSAHYTFYVEGTADRFVSPPEELVTDIACFGTLSLALEPGASRLAGLLRRLSAAGVFVALDPNIRPLCATDSHRAFVRSLLVDVDLLKLSEEEDAFLDDPQVPVKLITRGSEGIEIVLGKQRLSVPAPTVHVADTIGAGDTVMGCVLAEIHRLCGGKNVRQQVAGFDLDQWRRIAEFAATAAAINCTHFGANPPTREQVNEFIAC